MRKFLFGLSALLVLGACDGKIDREALVARNNPRLTALDPLASLTVGNGRFAFTADVTGLQTFPERYSTGVPLGTQSQWGWHSFPNPDGLSFDETLRAYDFGRGREELYACQIRGGRGEAASDWYRVNPHRLHLGVIGFAGIEEATLSDIDQTLDMWSGELRSVFRSGGARYEVSTCCDPDRDLVEVRVSAEETPSVRFRLPYPTGGHSDDACDWTKDALHDTEIVAEGDGVAVLRHTLDDTVYYIKVSFDGGRLEMTGPNEARLTADGGRLAFSALFCEQRPEAVPEPLGSAREAAARYWRHYWQDGAAVDFSRCTDPRAAELERRVVLSQYLMAVNCAGDIPPQETGLTYNSWFGKFHMEMIWWHQAHFPLWGHEDLLARTLPWYGSVESVARGIAERQGFRGVRWMKMTDPSGREAPSNVGSFLIWQQPHLIYLAELLYRADPSPEVLGLYADLVRETAEFMADFAEYDAQGDRYVLRGCIPAQETLQASKTVNPPFELSYWHFALGIAQRWRERQGLERDAEWDGIIAKLSHLAAKDGLYLAAESEPDTYEDIRMYSDHMAVLAAMGVLPQTEQMDPALMKNTSDWVMANWNWDETWGWDFPTTCMNAVRLGEPERAVDALMMEQRTNTYLPNGHNYQDARLRVYLPGNGGLLTAVALMCAGYDGCTVRNPGFPKDGTWDVRWEGLKPLP